MGVTNFDIVEANEFRSGSSTDGIIIPELSSNPTTTSNGEMWLMTTGQTRIQTAFGIAELGGTASTSLDSAYNGGSIITVDAGAVTLTDTQTGAGGGLLITKSGIVTGTADASVFHINSTGAHDTSGTVKFLEISVGTETIGTPIGMEIAMNANGDSAMTVTKGAVTLTDGAMTLTSGNFTMSSGNADITGTLTVSGASALQNITASGTYTGQGIMILDVDNAEAFLIRENGDAADVFTVDTTQDAGDTTVTVESKTTTGKALYVDGDTTTGTVLDVNADAVTTGDGIKVKVTSATMTTGSAISVIDGSTEVFSVKEDGLTTIAGTADGTDALVITKGDVTLSDGNLTLASGNLNVTGTVTYNSTSLSWTATSTTDDNFTFTSAATTADAMQIDSSVTTGSALKIVANSATTSAGVIHVTADAVTSGNLLYLDTTAAAFTGNYIQCYDGAAEDFSVGVAGLTTIAGTASGTDVLVLTKGDILVSEGGVAMTKGDFAMADGSVTIVDADNANTLAITNDTITTGDLADINSTSISTGALVKLNANTTAHDGEVLEIISAGDATSTPKGISVTMSALATGAGYGLWIDMPEATSGGTAIGVRADKLTSGDMLHLDNGGATLNGGYFINCNDDNVTDFGVGPDGATTIIQQVNSSTGLKIDGIWTSGYGIHVDNASGVIGDNKAMIFCDSGGAAASGSNMLRLEATGTPAAGSIALEIVGAGKVMRGVVTDTDGTADSCNTFNGGGALTNGLAVVEISNDGNLAAGGCNTLITLGGTPNADARAFEINGASKDAIGMFIDVDSATDSMAQFNSGGAIANNKAVVEITADGTPANIGSNLLRVDGSGLTDTNKPLLVEVIGTGKDTQGIAVDADSTTGSVALFSGSGAIANNKAIVEIVADGTPANAGSNVLRVDASGITDTNKPVLVEIIGSAKDCMGLSIDADPTTTDVALIHSDAVIASDKAVLSLTSAGAIASGGNVFRVDVTGTPASGAVYTEFDFAGITDTNENVGVLIDATSKKVQALKINAAPLAGSTILATSTGVLAANKATAEFVSNVSACNADSAVVRITQDHTTGVATCMALVQDDVDIPFITLETTIGVGNAIEAAGGKTVTHDHFIMVDIEGVGTKYIGVGDIA